jgi:ribosomal protein S15P/S13E
LQESFDKIQVLKNDLKKSRLTLCSTEKQLAEMSTRYKNLEGYFDSNKNANSAKVALELSQKEKRIEGSFFFFFLFTSIYTIL